MSELIHRGDHAKLEALLREVRAGWLAACSAFWPSFALRTRAANEMQKPSLLNEQMTGGATPLHVCGMSKRGQLAAQVLIGLGAKLDVNDTCGGCAFVCHLVSPSPPSDVQWRVAQVHGAW